ncbi:hypothetical protein FZ103_17875 [Streptomonospora sp. PA3]|uniref:hypothetical protein n=1 Tax=Streptomonospora sp. PA3 TaxID=2607326 RepID=UPI0012DCB589|nr:hypothetical protein [Streptomonospora sp. PA3]MUL43016.1 hypothetical protein [Streptomonospora sp. PA3]
MSQPPPDGSGPQGPGGGPPGEPERHEPRHRPGADGSGAEAPQSGREPAHAARPPQPPADPAQPSAGPGTGPAGGPHPPQHAADARTRHAAPPSAAGWAAPGAGPEPPGGRPPHPPQAPPPPVPPPGPPPGSPGAPPPEPEPISAAPAQSRGCATAAVAALAVVVLLLAGAGVWAIVALSTAAGGAYESAPDCSVAPGDVLDGLVPARQTELNRRIEDFDPERREGYECRWATPETAPAVPAAARLVLVRYADHTGRPGAEAASTALEAAARDASAHSVSGLGDEAKAWTEPVQSFEWGCVAVRMSNLYTMACHTAAVDYQATHSISGDLALANAESLARAVTAEIEKGDY